jgi:hypothetical protein
LADEDGAEPVVRWNSLTYQLQNQEAAARWSASSLHGKALVQGLKFDSAGNMYVTTARWEAELQAAVRAEVMLPSNTDGLTTDKDGNAYLTALQLNSVLKWERRGSGGKPDFRRGPRRIRGGATGEGQPVIRAPERGRERSHRLVLRGIGQGPAPQGERGDSTRIRR